MSIVDSFEFEGIRALRVGRFTFKPNTSAFFFQIGDTLVDTGPPNQWEIVQKFLKDQPIKQILLTHHHEDHTGNAARLARQKGAEVFIHHSGIAYCKEGFPIQYYRKIVWGVPEKFSAEPVPGIIQTSLGYALFPIHTPGHSVDMVCYWEPQKRWVFTGDLFITTRPQYLRVEEDIHLEILSLRKVLDLEFDTLFCSHRGKVENARDYLQEKYDYLINLRDQVQELVEKGWSLKRIRNHLLGKEEFLSYFTGFHFSKLNLIKALAEPPRRWTEIELGG